MTHKINSFVYQSQFTNLYLSGILSDQHYRQITMLFTTHTDLIVLRSERKPIESQVGAAKSLPALSRRSVSVSDSPSQTTNSGVAIWKFSGVYRKLGAIIFYGKSNTLMQHG